MKATCCRCALGVAFISAVLFTSVARTQAPKAGDKHDPANAVANLDIHPDLQATLFASEPMITNPTNLDIDARGRVWICDVVNYRGHNGQRPSGDRIMILEDTNGDGKADKAKVFYQGRDVDSAMGICVLGNKVIVSCSPNVLVFTKDDNDNILKKEVLFTKTGRPQHDHSVHSFVFGPDGKLYFNFGNTGEAVHDKNGKPVVDIYGNTVRDDGKPYRQGMVFRCDLDGSHFEVLANNFRNNYEIAVDSFGTLWQSDNDDDGNRGVRINYVMEFGNYGYVDEMTGAGWQSPRTNMEKEIPLRHWHLNDPGVVPNLLQTGAGSPAGICVYEGRLLPKVFQNQIIHCDPGPSIVRAYPVTKARAGYKAAIVNLLDGNKKNNWFRPVDVRVAPDGSLFITDWYDPGVGGHAQADSNRGRIFRVSPKGNNKYEVPALNFKTAAGAAKALKNPCSSVRYLAWTALHEMGQAAEGDLLKLWQDNDPRIRARALWLLGRIDGKAKHYVQTAIKDANADIRITGLRLARELKLDLIPLVRQLVADPNVAVLRECAIALRHNKSSEAPQLWANLVSRYQGNDRWYLEALGIGADRQWDQYLGTFLHSASLANTSQAHDIVWRSRSARTPALLAEIIRDPQTRSDELPRYFRAFDFQKDADKQAVLLDFVTGEQAADSARRNVILVESVKRLKDLDASKQAQVGSILEKTLQTMSDKATYIDLVAQFGISKHYPDLLAIAQQNPDQQLGVNAAKALLDKGQQAMLRQALTGQDRKLALATVQALVTAADARAVPLLLPFVQNAKGDLEARRQALRGVARTRNGARVLVKLARDKSLGEELKSAAAAALTVAPWKDVKADAVKLFPLAPGKGDKPLPAFAELIKMRGDVARGHAVFMKTGTCANCHIVNGAGKEVGPNLSEIGKKLSREAILESILFPSAGISHNYETYLLETKAGGLETGLLVSDTAEGVTLKGADGITRSFKRGAIESLRQSPVSLMPADLHKALTPQDLADLVDYLLTLREARTSAAQPPR